PHRPLSPTDGPLLGLRRCRVARRAAAVGLLLGADPARRRRVHRGVLAPLRLAPRGGLLALRTHAERAEADGARVRDDPQPVGPEFAERRVALVGAHAAGPVPGGGEQALAVDALPEERVEGDLGRAPPAGTVGRRGTEDTLLLREGAVQRLAERLAADQPPARHTGLLGGERLVVDRPLGPEEVAHALVHG